MYVVLVATGTSERIMPDPVRLGRVPIDAVMAFVVAVETVSQMAADRYVRREADCVTVDPATESRLVDAEDVDGVLALVSVDEIADAWCQCSVAHAPSEAVLHHIGAGPFEEFIRADENRVRWIEEQAASSSKFRTALANVWIWDQPNWVFERVQRAAGVPLAH